MPETVLDVRGRPPFERHSAVHEAFSELDSGETLRVVDDHEPGPLFHELRESTAAFDADRYVVEQRGPREFVASFPRE